jgi:hypothetical protein
MTASRAAASTLLTATTAMPIVITRREPNRSTSRPVSELKWLAG